MARISYDDQTAKAYKQVREVPRAGLEAWREAVGRYLRPSPGMTVLDIGAGTGQFSAAFTDWFDIDVVAVEPSEAMRTQIRQSPRIRVLEGNATAIPLADASIDAAWLSLVIHHVPDLRAAASEIRRVLRPGAPVLIRQGFPGRADQEHTFPWEFFPETERMVNSYPSIDHVIQAFAAAGFRREALEPVPETLMTVVDFLDRVDRFRHADTVMRSLTEEEYERGKERLRRAAAEAQHSGVSDSRTSWLDLLVLR
jgi:ubiquinone/menaquinone biosynthesis C-methylase UbiE